MCLNSIKIISNEYDLSKKLNNQEAYSKELHTKIYNHISYVNKHYSSEKLGEKFALKTNFPLGKTGREDLIKLFEQFEGKNIFQIKKIDIDKLDSIFLKKAFNRPSR